MKLSRIVESHAPSIALVQCVMMLAAVVSVSNSAWAQCEIQKLIASNPHELAHFGYSVDVDGDTAVIGAIDLHFDPGIGTAYIFQRDINGVWGEVVRVNASDASVFDQFGYSVSLSGDTALIGSPFDDDLRGAVYVFNRDHTGPDAWGEFQKITASDGADADRFGWAVDIEGGRAVVCSPRDGDKGSQLGAAYIFERNKAGTWIEVKKLTASNPVSQDEFGFSGSLSGDYAIIGAHNANAAYIFHRNEGGPNQWGEVDILSGTSGEFGFSVAIHNDRAIVGAPFLNDGEASIYARDEFGNWNFHSTLTPEASVDGANRNFGFSVAIEAHAPGEGTIAIGAQGDDDHCPSETPDCETGAVYIYQQQNGNPWLQTRKLYSSDNEFNDSYGWSVSLQEPQLFVGAKGDSDSELYMGAAYVVDMIGGPDCNENRVCDDYDILLGTSTDDNSNGIPDDCEVDCNENDIPDSLEIELGLVPDCNENGIIDECDIDFALSCDRNDNTVPDECEGYCLADLNCNRIVNVDDLLILIGDWGPCPAQGECIADLILNGTVNIDDLLDLIAAWGACPT